MKIFKRLQYKIIIPPLLMFLVVVILALVIGKDFFQNSMDKRITKELTSESDRLQEYIKYHVEEINSKAMFFSVVKQIQDDFVKSEKIVDRDSCKKMFEQDLPFLKQNKNIDINFYTKNIRSLYSNSTLFFINEKDKALLSEVERTGRPISGIDFFAGENRVLSIIPVFKNKKVIGLITVSSSFKQLANRFYLPEQEEFVLTDLYNKIQYQSSFEGKGFQDFNQEFKYRSSKWFVFQNYYIYPLEIISLNNQPIAKAFVFFDTTEEIAFLKNLIFYLLLFSIAAFVIGGLIYAYGISRTVIYPIRILRKKILLIAKGEQTEVLKINRVDELGEMVDAVNVLINNQQSTAIFASKIGMGEFNEELSLLSDKDMLGNALIKMKDNLVKAKEMEQKRKEEDKHRQWTAEGLAKFAEILRQNNDNMQRLGDEIIKELVRYVGAVQGGLFIINDNDKNNIVLDLVSAYAYDRKKYMEKKIPLGEGLIGTCAIEKLPIYMTDIPDDYVEITSGLGQANPRNILLVPLKIEEDVFGVIELASFDILEPYKVEFIEKLTESIASTLNSVKINIVTAQLLEQSQQQSEELSAQEEEMRQNLEEMQATQEEAQRREEELGGVIDAVDSSFGRLELNNDREVILVNTKLAESLDFQAEILRGKDFLSLIDENQYDSFINLWEDVQNGERKKIAIKLYNTKKKLIKFNLIISPILDYNGTMQKVILLFVEA